MTLMTKRLLNFEALKTHPLRGKDFDHLNILELIWAEGVIVDNRFMTTDEYVQFLNRMSIKDSVVREKNRTRLWSLLLEAATAEVPKRERRK